MTKTTKSNVELIRNVKLKKPKIRKNINSTTLNKKVMVKDKKDARAGEVWSVNDKIARGHPSLITKRKKQDRIEYLPTTHSPRTFGRKNIKLQQNFDIEEKTNSYILSKIYQGEIKDLGKYHPELYVRNNIDKSIIRILKNKNKKR